MVIAKQLRCLLSDKPGDLSLIPVSLDARREPTLENCDPTSHIHTMMCNPPPLHSPPHTHTHYRGHSKLIVTSLTLPCGFWVLDISSQTWAKSIHLLSHLMLLFSASSTTAKTSCFIPHYLDPFNSKWWTVWIWPTVISHNADAWPSNFFF